MNKNNFNIDYFMQNEAFVKWIKSPDSELNLFWQEWLNLHPASKEELLKAKELILAMNFESLEPTESEGNEVLQHILQQNESSSAVFLKESGRHFWKWTVRVAASITLLILSTYIFFGTSDLPNNEISAENEVLTAKSNPYGRKSKLAFSDGSTATLNAGSTLRYLGKFDPDRREVELEGEAFFEVDKDINRPFVVRFGDISTTVLGTSFNIEAHPDDALSTIMLKTGKLKVEIPSPSGDQQTFLLTPGQKLIYDKENKKVDLLGVDTDDMALWTEGVLVFEDDNFKTIAKKMSRWFDVQVNFEGLEKDDIKFSTRYKKENLNNILISMGFALNFDYEVNEKTVKIKFKEK